ncbi:MAG: hypothetical protein JXR58_10235 [Bacteroidales bacterium]|nr:hypothetical protein [Bacteroidales bacterium]
MTSIINKTRHQYLLLLVLCFVLYGNTIPNKYSLDDEYVVYNHPLVEKGFAGIPQILVSHYSDIGEKNFGYRPLVKLSFAIETGIFGINPHVSHTINVLLYFLLLVVILLILKRILRDYHPIIPLLITIIFAAHPIHTEVVASLKNRDQLLSDLCGFSSLLFLLRYADLKKIKFIVFALLLFIAGYFSKQGIVVFFLLIPLSLYFFTDMKMRKILIFLLAILVVSVILKYLPRTFLTGGNRPIDYYENPLFYDGGIVKRFALGFLSGWYYLGFLLFPHPLKYYYGYNEVPMPDLGDPAVIASILIHLALLVYAILGFKRKSILSFSILFYLISVSIYLNVLQPVMGIVGERFVFVGSFSFSILLVLALYRIFNENGKKILVSAYKTTSIIAILLIIVIFYGCKTVFRNTNWKDHETLYTADMPKLEKSVKANELMAFIIMDDVYKDFNSGKDLKSKIKKIETAKRCYYRSLDLYFENQKTWINLGSMYSNFYHNYDSAIICYKNVLKFSPKDTKALMNIGKVYELQNNFDQSYKYWQEVIIIDSSHIEAISQLSKIENKRGNFDLAKEMNERIMKIAPESDLPYINIANFLYMKGEIDQAIKYAETAIKKNPDNYKVCNLLSDYFDKKGKNEKARHYKRLAAKSTRK